MTTTADLLDKIKQDRTYADAKGRLAPILESWEGTWGEKGPLTDQYRARVNACERIYVWVGKRDAHTNVDSCVVVIKVANGVPDRKPRGDDVDGRIGKSQMSGWHDVADALIFELGNCVYAKKFVNIKKSFYGGTRSLHDAGEEFARWEARGQVGYLDLMKAIKAEHRPYQTNRNVDGYRNCQDETAIVTTFCGSAHDVTAASGALTLRSDQGYTYEMVSRAKKQEIIPAAQAIGAKLLALAPGPAKKAWDDIVGFLATSIGVQNQSQCDVFYDATTELINGLRKAGYGGPGLTDKDWLLDADMKKGISKASVRLAPLHEKYVAFRKALGTKGVRLPTAPNELRGMVQRSLTLS